MTFNLPSLRHRSNAAVLERDNRLDSIFDNFYSFFPELFATKDKSLVPRIDVSETNKSYQIDAELPGIELKDIDVQVDGNLLTIKGKKEENIESKERNYYMQERYVGSFQRSISLPNNAAIEQINAKLKDGVLQLTIPKKEQAITKSIGLVKSFQTPFGKATRGAKGKIRSEILS